MKKLLLMALCATFINFCALAQMTITNDAKVTVETGGLVKVDGKLEIQSGGELKDEPKTMEVLYAWMKDSNAHVRRLCSEGTRQRLPWSKKIDSFITDPSPSIPILEHLKNDTDLYVRRSVANHIGDIAKVHLDLALDLCEKWLDNASTELKWVIRHSLRNPAKRKIKRAVDLRHSAK